MADGFIIQRINTAGFGSIVVNYPSGSSCTCSNGSTTLTASTSTGEYVFSVPSSGTWTITSTKDTQTASASVSITTINQVAEVNLSYDIILYNAGNIYENVTGGWNNPAVTSGSAGWSVTTSSFDTDFITMTSASASMCSISTKNKISLVGKTSLNISIGNYSTKGNSYGHSEIGIAAASTFTDINCPNFTSVYGAYQTINGTGVFSLDITSHQSSFYIVVFGGSRGLTVNKIWIE